MEIPTVCALCPRRCGANRRLQPGRCGGGSLPRVARAAPHHWEEPCISGSRGSGTVFFCGCGLGCVFCQNHAISRGAATGQAMTPGQLAGCFLGLQAQGMHNLNLVTATHYLPWVLDALENARAGGLALPVVWNTGGYETEEAVLALGQAVDVWLFDLKFHSAGLATQLAGAPDYFRVASAALQRACALTGPPVFSSDGLLLRGVVVRLLVLPGHHRDAMALLDWLAGALPKNGFLLSLMSQYTPPGGLALPPPLGRRVSSYEYGQVARHAVALGLTQGYTQGREAASEAYVPPFDLP